MKFRLLHSDHTIMKWESISPEEARLHPNCIKDEFDGSWKRLVSTVYTAGDVFESDVDLVAKFGRTKFEKVNDDTETRSGGPTIKERLLGLTIADLRELAIEDEIDLNGLTKKADILEALSSHYEKELEV